MLLPPARRRISWVYRVGTVALQLLVAAFVVGVWAAILWWWHALAHPVPYP